MSVERVEDEVRGHYQRDELEGVVDDALRRSGIDPATVAVDQLGGLDQLHAGGALATRHLLDRLALVPGLDLLDVGCGIGGPARLAAHDHDVTVTGIDLSPDFVELGRALTERVGLADRVHIDIGSAAEVPYDEATFDRAMLNHVGMNLPDKAAVFAEVRRVLRSDGRFVIFDQMRLSDGDLTYPLPWADEETWSFVETSERYRELLEQAGFRIELEEDRTAEVAAVGPPAPGALSPGDLFGPGFVERMTNNIVATMEGLLHPVLIVAIPV